MEQSTASYSARADVTGLLTSSATPPGPLAINAQVKPAGTRGYLRLVEGRYFGVNTNTPRDTELRSRFLGLAKRWKRETGDYSIIGRRYAHSAYKAILNLGIEVVPEILIELRRDPDRWFGALEHLTKQNPAKSAKTFYEAVDRWIAWGISEGYLRDS